jgi:hypothetical protein
MSIARRLAHDLGVYYKLDADIVLDTEMVLSSQGSTTTLTEPESGNIVVIGNPSGQYIRQCLEKGKTAFSIADRQDGPPLLQLRGETLNDSSQGILYLLTWPFVIVNTTRRYPIHTSSRKLAIVYNAVHHRTRPIGSGAGRASLPYSHWAGSGGLDGDR